MKIQHQSGPATFSPSTDVRLDDMRLVPHGRLAPGAIQVVGKIVLPVISLLNAINIRQRNAPDDRRVRPKCRDVTEKSVQRPRARRLARVLPGAEINPRSLAAG